MHKWLGKVQWNIIARKKDFYNYLTVADIIDADYTHIKRACKDFKITNLGEYHDLYVQSNTWLLADVFENFWNICLDIFQLETTCFLIAPWIKD